MAVVRKVDGRDYTVEHYSSTKEGAQRIARELKRKHSFIGSVRIFARGKLGGYEIGWSYT
jgi:hypothetical protein